MNLAEILGDRLRSSDIKYDILAIDDNFAATSKVGQNIYQMAGRDSLTAEKTIRRIMNNV